MICASCQEEIGPGFRFCPHCGERVPPPASQADGDIVNVRGTVVKAGTVFLGGDHAAAQFGAGECGICGKYNRRDETFRCRDCGREYLCLRHQDPDLLICQECAKPRREAEEASRQAALELARHEAERQRKEELERQKVTAEETARQAARQATVLTLAPGVTLELVRVPAGPFLMGSADSDSEAYGDEMPQHSVALGEYYVGKHPVTVAQFAAFVKATGHTDWTAPSAGKENHPVTQVSWDDAMAFTQWASQVTGRVVRLPTEAEWEKAARGTDGRTYPWGNEAPDSTRCNFDNNMRDTTPVGKYSPRGDSPCGAADMSGNVWGWTSSLLKKYPYMADDGRENPASGEARVLCGGSFVGSAVDVRSAYRNCGVPSRRRGDGGFRVVASPIPL
jgi:formylglycine-generating enzyme required for sulfatase activity